MKSFEFGFSFSDRVEGAEVGFQFFTEKVEVGAPRGLEGSVAEAKASSRLEALVKRVLSRVKEAA